MDQGDETGRTGAHAAGGAAHLVEEESGDVPGAARTPLATLARRDVCVGVPAVHPLWPLHPEPRHCAHQFEDDPGQQSVCLEVAMCEMHGSIELAAAPHSLCR